MIDLGEQPDGWVYTYFDNSRNLIPMPLWHLAELLVTHILNY